MRRLLRWLEAELLLAPVSMAWPWRLLRRWREPRWSLRFRIARRLHVWVNRAAWKWARPPGPAWGIALRIDKTHPLWRLNDWLAEGWTGEYVRAAMERQERERRKELSLLRLNNSMLMEGMFGKLSVFEYERRCACDPVEVLTSPPDPPRRILFTSGIERVAMHVQAREPIRLWCGTCEAPWRVIGERSAGRDPCRSWSGRRVPIMENGKTDAPNPMTRESEQAQHEKGEQDLTNAGGSKPVGGKTTNAPPHTAENPGGMGKSDLGGKQ